MAGIEMGEGADGARDLADRDRFAGAQHPVEAALQLGVPERELQAEGHRLGVDAVRPADHRRPPVLLGARAHRLHQRGEPLDDEVAGLAHLQRLRGVDHVRRGEAEVQPPRGRPDALGHRRREGDDVVLRGLLDLLDARHVERGRARSSRAASAGTMPASAIASAAASSTSSHVS
jgi:hypothetical protein